MAADLNSGAFRSASPIIVAADNFARQAARSIAEAISRASERHAPVSVALAGGRGPRSVYQELAGAPGLPWERLEVYFTDERAVPATDPESNYRLVSETLGPRFSGRASSIHRMEADRSDLAQAAAEYEASLPAELDVLVLGMGEDGHTASLFPGHPATSEERRRVLGIRGPATPPWRMTITPPVILAAREILMLVAGSAKAAAVARVYRDPYDPVACPAQLARHALWILDEQAASQLPTRSV